MGLRKHQAERRSIHKIFKTYLSPFTIEVTEGCTICSYMTYLQKFPEQVYAKCVCVTLDVGAAMNALKMSWSYPNEFSIVVIELGNFYFMKDKFKVNLLLFHLSMVVTCNGLRTFNKNVRTDIILPLNFKSSVPYLFTENKF